MNTKRMLALLLALIMVFGLVACGGDADPTTAPTETPETPETNAPAVATYIPAPYTATTAEEVSAEFLTPVFYENENGPTVGVTLLGVIELDGQYFRDMNNNQQLDTFEDWRLDVDTRAAAFAAAQSDFQLCWNVCNNMMYSPKSAKVEDVVDENGNPVWNKVYPATAGLTVTIGAGGMQAAGGNEAPAEATGADIINFWDNEGWRNFVVRNNPATEVAVWFNNGLEQYAEFNAITKGEVAVPFLSFTNPIAHGMPGNEGIAAAAIGDGNADFVLADAQYDRVVMWSKGIDGIYGPQIDLVTDPRWSRNNGTYGERVDILAEIARNYTIGYQNGDQGLVPGSVVLTVKHFPGDGAAYNGFESHGQTGRYRIYSTENSLADYHLKPFIAAFEAGAAGVMPGYSQPIIDERIAPQSITYNGQTYDIKLEGRGNAFNPDVLQYLLREVLGFDGLINSDSLHVASQQGVEDLSEYERAVLYIKSGCQAGVLYFNEKLAAEYFAEALTNGDLTRADLEAAAAGRAKVHILNGNLDNPYRDMEESVAAVNEVAPKVAALAEETHLKSVVLMKNANNALPMTDTSKKVYVHGFNQNDNLDVAGMIASLEAEGFTIVDDYKTADIAYLFVNPTIVGQGASQLAILDLDEDMETPIYDNNAKRTEETADITTVAGMKTFKKIADAVHANGGTVVGRIEASDAWILTNMEPYCDALLGTFKTSDNAVAQVLTGKYNPTGKLPITMVADASVIALVETDLNGEIWDVCVSPNDVPGYVKDQYMDADVLAASPSGSYAYKDAAGNFYTSGFGLDYNAESVVIDNQGSNEVPEETKPADDKPAVSNTDANIELDYNSDVTKMDGEWKLAAVYADGAATAAVADALTLKISMESDPSELVDGEAYIHNQVWNLTGYLTFGLDDIVAELAADDVDSYKGTTAWSDFPQGEVVAEGEWYKQPGPATMRFKDIDDYGLYLDLIAGTSANIDTTEKTLIIGLNSDGQLLLGYCEEHLERPGTEGEWVYLLIFDKA